MSYEIIYARQFIKVDENRVIPFVLCGSNNVWEANNRRRSRSWWALCFDGNKAAYTLDELLKQADERRKYFKSTYEDYNDKYFSYYSSITMYGRKNLTFNAYKSFFKNGFKNAVTIEELRDNNVSLSFFLEKGSENETRLYPTTSEELAKIIDEKGNLCLRVYAGEMGMQDFLDSRKAVRTRKRREPITVDSYYKIRTEQGGYFVRKTKYGYKYSFYDGKKYKTEKAAQKKVDELMEISLRTFVVEEQKLEYPQAIRF